MLLLPGVGDAGGAVVFQQANSHPETEQRPHGGKFARKGASGFSRAEQLRHKGFHIAPSNTIRLRQRTAPPGQKLRELPQIRRVGAPRRRRSALLNIQPLEKILDGPRLATGKRFIQKNTDGGAARCHARAS